MLISLSNYTQSKTTIPTFRLIAHLIENRYANVKASKIDQRLTAFYNEFNANYAAPILESHVNIILGKKTKFVGTKTLCYSIKLLCTAIKDEGTR